MGGEQTSEDSIADNGGTQKRKRSDFKSKESSISESPNTPEAKKQAITSEGGVTPLKSTSQRTQ